MEITWAPFEPTSMNRVLASNNDVMSNYTVSLWRNCAL